MSDATRWLDAEAAARYLSVRPDALPRLVRAGRIPPPFKTLGDRSPRWDRLALDAAFDGGVASTDPSKAVEALVQKMQAEGRARREANAGRRDGAGISLRSTQGKAAARGR